MSHFAVLVITPNGTEEEAEELLAPFDENTEVEAYQKQCWCVGQKARQSVRNKLDIEIPIEKARTDFQNREDVKQLVQESKDSGNYGFSEQVDVLWETSFVRPYEAREAELLALEPGGNDADPACEECSGSGVETTTYNPKSKWDWYSLGGRWQDVFGGMQGISLSEFIDSKDEDGKPYRTFAIVTPDGQWIEKGKMLFFAVVADKKDPVEWEECYAQTLEKYRDHKALFFDCHI